MEVLTQGKGDKILEGIFIFALSLKRITKLVSFKFFCFYHTSWGTEIFEHLYGNGTIFENMKHLRFMPYPSIGPK